MEKVKVLSFLEKYKYFAIIILVGICFMILTPNYSSEEENIEETNFSIDEMEQKLEDILSEIYGVGKVSVMLTTKGTSEGIYVKDEEKNAENGEQNLQTIVISQGGGGETPIKIMDIYPEYLGALIVCEGADNSAIKLEIINAVSSLCDIKSDKITISKMK